MSDDLVLLRQFGWMMSQNLNDLELSEAEASAFQDGLRAGLAGEQLISQEQMEMVNQRLQTMFRERYMSRQNRENAEYLAELRENPDIIESDSGLFYEIIEPGEGEPASSTDRVEVHYVGTLIDGTTFDSSRERGQPATFPVNQVVPGFGEGVQLVGPGGQVKLHIPPDLGYGDRSQGNIPPRSILLFDVEVMDVLEGQPQQQRPQMPQMQGQPQDRKSVV